MLERITTRNGKLFRGLNEESLKNIKLANRTIIYGLNGSGKSSISQLLADLDSLDPDWKPVWLDGQNKIYVFNDEYVSKNLREFVEQGGTSPSIIVGEKLIELADRKNFYAEQIENSEKRIARLQDKVDESSPDKILKDAKQDVIEQLEDCDAKKYNTAAYRAGQKLSQRIQEANPTAINSEDFDRLKEIGLRANVDLPAAPMQIDIQQLKNAISDIREILATTLPTPEHLRFSDLPGFSDWVTKGLTYTDQTGDECPFCLNQIEDARMSQLIAEYRDKTRKLLSGRLDSIESELDTSRQLLTDYLESIDRVDISDSIISNKLDDIRDRIKKAAETLKKHINELDSALSAKQKEMESPYFVAEYKGFDALEKLNIELSELCTTYNETLETWESDKKSAIEEIEEHILSKYRSPLVDAIDQHRRLTGLKDLISGHVLYYTTELNNILAGESNSLKMATYISSGISLVLGRNDLEVEANSDGLTYSLIRQGEPARNLSEGERQIIAILYFLATLKSNNVNLDESVIVVDDPTTGLDRNNYRSLFEHIHRESHEWPQLILLTHDFTFFSTAIRTFQTTGSVEKWGEPTLLLTERNWSDASKRYFCCARYAPLSMTKYSSEYYAVFHNVARAAAGLISGTDLSMYGNAGRRLLESFLSYHAPNNHDVTASIISVWENIEWSRIIRLKVDSEYNDSQVSRALVEIPLSVIRRFHSFSHDASTTPFEEPLMMISSEDFTKLAFLMRSIDREHFDLMIECVDTEGEGLRERVGLSMKPFYGSVKRYINSGVVAL